MERLMISSDLAFKAVFGRENEKCKEALKNLLNTILGIKINTIVYINPINEKSFIDDKQTEFDINVTTDKGEHIDIEMQLLNKVAFR